MRVWRNGVLGAHGLEHSGPVLCVAAAPAVCYSGGGDGTLRAWALPELRPLLTFEDAKEGGKPIKAVLACAGLVVSGSDTGALRVHGGCHDAQPPPAEEPASSGGSCACKCAVM